MASSILILGVALLSIVLAWTLLRSGRYEVSSLSDWEARKYAIDVQMFQALVDVGDQRRLQHCLPSQQYRHFQRRRIRLAIRLLRMIEVNASMLINLASLARTTKDPMLRVKADELIGIAVQLRLKLLLLKFYLSLAWVFPSWSISSSAFEPGCREMLKCAIEFQQLGRQALI